MDEIFNTLFEALLDRDVDGYQLIRIIGRGGYGCVYLAQEIVLGEKKRKFAAKFIPINPDDCKQAKSELDATSDLDNPYLLKAVKVGSHVADINISNCEKLITFLYIVMPLAEGDLSKLTTDEAIVMTRHIATALNYLHNYKPRKIHRDLKPNNILKFANPNGGFTYKLADLGLVRDLINNKSLTHSSTWSTTLYMPPEAVSRGAVSSAWDIYSFGITLIEALTGRLPYQIPLGLTRSELQDRIQEMVVNQEFTIPNLPTPFNLIVKGCLILDPHLRWTAQNVLDALQPAERVPPAQPRTTPHRVVTQPKSSRRSLLYGGVAVVCVGGILGWDKLFKPQESITSSTKTSSPIAPTPIIKESLPLTETLTPKVTPAFNELILDCGNGVKLELVVIPTGSFRMGSNENYYADNYPFHRVRVPSFYMGKYTVTQEQYEVVMGNNPSYFKGTWLPIEHISWDDTQKFCAKLSQKTGKKVRLPSEAEWEYACRAGTTTAFSFGDNITTNQVNYDGNYPTKYGMKGESRKKTVAVDALLVNQWGLYQMHGNVGEWCEDMYHENYNEAPADGSAWVTGGDNNVKVVRGGSWVYNADACMSVSRNWLISYSYSNDIGFRIAISI
jgi:eukaryotic-like serine/threonine-protein kinase